MPSYTLGNTAQSDDSIDTITITAPTRSAGNLILVWAYARSAETAPTVTGYTTLVSDDRTALYGRIATNDASDNWSGDFSGTTRSFGLMSCWSGDVYTDLNTIVAHSSFRVPGSDADPNPFQWGTSTPALTVTTDDCLVLICGRKTKTVTADGSTFAAEAGFTRIDYSCPAGTRNIGIWDYVQQTTAANIAPGTWDRTAGANESQTVNGLTIALKTSSTASTATPVTYVVTY